MPRKNLELWLALLVILLISLGYVWYVLEADVPAASGFFGHTLGIIGFVLMLMTEILYSLRKRSKSARWGKLQHWLSFHIFTGLVGPFLVLLHSSWKFNGLAGILSLLTGIIVLSGFIGRYFYTALPRDAEGSLLEIDQLQSLLTHAQVQLTQLLKADPALQGQLGQLLASEPKSFKALKSSRRAWQAASQGAHPPQQELLERIQSLWEQQQSLRLQLGSIADRRRLLALWHTFHVPLGVTTFMAAFLHVAAALYYATLLH